MKEKNVSIYLGLTRSLTGRVSNGRQVFMWLVMTFQVMGKLISLLILTEHGLCGLCCLPGQAIICKMDC